MPEIGRFHPIFSHISHKTRNTIRNTVFDFKRYRNTVFDFMSYRDSHAIPKGCPPVPTLLLTTIRLAPHFPRIDAEEI